MRLPIAVPLLVFLAACGQQPSEPAASVEPQPAGPVAPELPAEPEPAFDTSCEFCANPDTVRTCDVADGVSTVLYWDVSALDVPQVGIYVVDEAGLDSPFAEQPSKGSIETGPWLTPGLTFKLKDPDGTVLHTITIEGTDC